MNPVSAVGLAASVVGLLATVSGASRRLRRLRRGEPSTSFGIEVLDDGSENPVADICFVHGLNEDRVSAWQSTNSGDKDKFWWPKTLQEKIHARILLYGYSTVAPTAEYLARRTLYHQAEHLVESLADVRKDYPRRPLIFVARSLGGIVVQSALIFSSQSPEPNSPARAIVLSTAGIVFLGTPHKVHRYLTSSPDSVLKKIARVSGSNRQILDHLNEESSALQSYLEPFSALSTEISTVSFFESRGSESLGLVVPSSMAFPGTEHYFLDSNHANLGKFQGYDEHGYRMVVSVIQEMCQKATSLVNKNWEKYQQRNEPNAYRENDQRQDDFRVPPHLPPPTPWFTGREDALEWIEKSLLVDCSPDCPKNCHTVNLYGLGGIGKSQIAMAFADRFCNRFSAVFWIASQTHTTIEQEYLRIARTLQSPTFGARDGSSAREMAYLVLEWL